MLHEFIYDSMWIQCFLLPIFSYLYMRGNYLDSNQIKLLLIGSLWVGIHAIGGWLAQVLRIVIFGLFSLILLETSSQQINQLRLISQKSNVEINQEKYLSKKIILIDKIKSHLQILKLQQTFPIIVLAILWIMLKVYFTQAYKYGIGLQLSDKSIFNGFIQTYHGWNCRYTQYAFFPIIWTLILIFSRILVLGFHEYKYILTRNSKCNFYSYSQYLLNYLINPTLIVASIESFYNIFALLYTQNMLECYEFFKFGAPIQLIYHIGIPLIIIFFFYKKSGQFQIRSSTISNSANSSDSNQNNISPKRLLEQEAKQLQTYIH